MKRFVFNDTSLVTQIWLETVVVEVLRVQHLPIISLNYCVKHKRLFELQWLTTHEVYVFWFFTFSFSSLVVFSFHFLDVDVFFVSMRLAFLLSRLAFLFNSKIGPNANGTIYDKSHSSRDHSHSWSCFGCWSKFKFNFNQTYIFFFPTFSTFSLSLVSFWHYYFLLWIRWAHF